MTMKRFPLLLMILSCLQIVVQAQDIDFTNFSAMNMRSIGPAAMSGRVTSIDAQRDNPAIIYVGTASGGLWKSESMGVSWTPIFDDQPVQSIGAVAISPGNSSVIWAGTGEGNPRNSHSSGAGIFKSLDAGRTWKCMGLENTKTIHRIIVDPKNENVVYVAAMGSVWGPNTERGVFKTTDGGESWTKVLFTNDESGCADLVMDPKNPNKLVAAMWEYGRKPWTFNSGGEGSGIFITHNGGKTWEEKSKDNGLPEKPLGRVGLAISASNPNVIYALVESKKTGLYRSDDGGFKWNLVSTTNIGNRPFYYADIFVDPKNENRVFNLYSMVSMSEDGGKNFSVILPYSGVHPDHHAFYINPDNPDLMMDGNDGGLNISHDGGENWEFVSTLPLGQFYHIDYDMETPYHVYGGMQDNGSWQGPAYVWHHDGIRNEDWKEILFGDGFDVLSNPSDPNFAYAMYQGGNVYEVDIESGSQTYIKPSSADSIALRFNWNGAMAADPFDENGLYFGSQFLHHSSNRGLDWEILSPDLTTNDTTKQKQALSGGLTIDATQAENYTTIICISPSPMNEKLIWVGTDDGNIQLTKDGGDSWIKVNPKNKDFPAGAWIPQIQVNTKNEAEAFAVINDYRRNNWEPYVYHTLDYGKTWTRIVSSKQVSGHCHALVQDPIEEKLLFLGTENGLYFSLNKGTHWQKWTHDFPSVSTIDLKIHPREHDLIIGTFGRAAFILDNIVPLRELASNPNFQEQNLFAFDSPDAYLAHFMRPAGSRFMADHVFEGENKSSAGKISVWVNPEFFETKEETKSVVADEDKKLKICIFDEQGDTIRQFTAEPDTGLTIVQWGLNRNGVNWPSRSERDSKSDPPGGRAVGPGNYMVKINLLDDSVETSLRVLPDPRVQFNDELWREKELLASNLEKLVSKADRGFERIKEAKAKLDLVDRNLKLIDEATSDSLKKEMKSLTEKLEQLELLYMLPESFEGYDHVTKRLSDYLWNVSGYLGTYASGIGENANSAYNHAKLKTDEAIEEINLFFQNDWESFNSKLEEIEFNFIKKYENIE